jgi:geranylgeranyl diphosphate synthase, type I
MLHTSALIHDDVVDRAHLRRGEAASFRLLALMPEVDCGADRFGASAAILAGDLAHVFADQLLSESGFGPDRIQAARRHFNRMRTEAVSGQFMDLLEAHSALAASAEDVPGGEADAEQRSRRVAALKSGSYTVVGPLQMGAALAGAGRSLHRTLERYGRPLGEAFQLRDDVLGTFGDPAFTGKDCDGDIREGKRTTLVAKAWRLSTGKGRRLLADGLGRDDLTGGEVEAIRGVIRGSGALAETIELIEGLAARARLALGAGPFPEDAARALSGLADLVALRDA